MVSLSVVLVGAFRRWKVFELQNESGEQPRISENSYRMVFRGLLLAPDAHDGEADENQAVIE